jgi:hypothetical protein
MMKNTPLRTDIFFPWFAALRIRMMHPRAVDPKSTFFFLATPGGFGVIIFPATNQAFSNQASPEIVSHGA